MLYVQSDDMHTTNCIPHATSKHSTCLLPANPVLNLLYFVCCHRKPLLFIYLLSKKSFSSSYSHPDWNPSNKSTTIHGPSLEMLMLTNTGNAEATSTFKSWVAWFVQKPKTCCWSSWCGWTGSHPGKALLSSNTCMNVCTYIFSDTHFTISTLMSKFIIISGTCAETHLNLQVYKINARS